MPFLIRFCVFIIVLYVAAVCCADDTRVLRQTLCPVCYNQAGDFSRITCGDTFFHGFTWLITDGLPAGILKRVVTHPARRPAFAIKRAEAFIRGQNSMRAFMADQIGG